MICPQCHQQWEGPYKQVCFACREVNTEKYEVSTELATLRAIYKMTGSASVLPDIVRLTQRYQQLFGKDPPK